LLPLRKMLFVPLRSLFEPAETIEPCIEGCYAGAYGDSDGGAAGPRVTPSYWVMGPTGPYIPAYFE